MKRANGDTIVEVIIAIAVAAFAISTSYAIASHSLQRAVNSRERNQAINIIQSQISALKLRQESDPSGFDAAFGVPSGYPGTPQVGQPAIASHFCLDAQSQDSDNTGGPWAAQDNTFNNDSQVTTLSGGPNGYSSYCDISNDGNNYFVDITAELTTASQHSTEPTVYNVAVRWNGVGTTQQQQASVYYRF